MDITRRDALIAGLAAAASASGAGPDGATQAGPHGGRPQLALDGELRRDRATRALAAEDFGHLVRRRPAGVLLPASERDVAEIIRWSKARGAKVAPQGRRHSVWGRSQTGPDGVVIDVSALPAVREVARDRVVVDAGATWSEVLAATLPSGKTPPVLCEYLHLSVGGTLSVGGIGATTPRFGAQTDNVRALRVVTGDGDVLACSADQRADLFDAVRAGLGQVGVITQATLRLVDAPRQVRRFLLFYERLETLLRDARRLAADGRFDGLQGAILRSPAGAPAFRLDLAAYFTRMPLDDAALLAGLADDPARRQVTTSTYADYVDRFSALESMLRANGQWSFPHPWLTTFVGSGRVERVVTAELGRLEWGADLGEYGQIVLSPIRRSAVSTPLLRLPPDRLSFAFNLIRMPATADLQEAHRLVEANTAVYRRIRAAGGTLYPVSAFPLSRAGWRRHFGPAFGRLQRAKRRYDPGNVLTPGYDVF